MLETRGSGSRRCAILAGDQKLWTPGQVRFWDDAHVSKQMLAAHLDPTTNAASEPLSVVTTEGHRRHRELDLRTSRA